MNHSDHLVSVLMPVCNGGNLFAIALDSVRNQDYPNFEIIVVNDGSTDGTDELLESFSNSWLGRIKILTHPGRQRKGIAASYRLGLENCQGNYVAFLEHDDFWPTNKISEQIKAFNAFPDVGVVFSDVYPCNEEGMVAVKAFKTLINRPPSQRPFNAFWRLLWGDFVSTFSNFMVRHNRINISDIVSEPEGFQDWMFLLLLSSRCQFYHCDRTKIYWRQRQDSYYGRLRQLPKFMSNYRRLRKVALKKTISKMLLENHSSYSGRSFADYIVKKYWYSVISLFSAFERVLDFLNPQSLNRRTPAFPQNKLLNKGLQTQHGYEEN